MRHAPSPRLVFTTCLVTTLLSPASSARADVFHPVPGPDSAAGNTLRAAIVAANATPGDDTIVLGNGVYEVSLPNAGVQENLGATGDLDVNQGTVEILGAGAGVSIISVLGEVDRAFWVAPGARLELRALLVSGGRAHDDGSAVAPLTTAMVGGGIGCTGCSLELETVILVNNAAAGGPVGQAGPGAADVAGSGVAGPLASLLARHVARPDLPAAARPALARAQERLNAIVGPRDPGRPSLAAAVAGGADGNRACTSGTAAFGGGIYAVDATVTLAGDTLVSDNAAVACPGSAGADAPGATAGGDGGAAAGGGLYVEGTLTVGGAVAFQQNVAIGGNGGLGGADGTLGGLAGGDGGSATGGALYLVATELSLPAGSLIDSSILFGGQGGQGGSGLGSAPGGAGGDGGDVKGAGIFVVAGSVALQAVDVNAAIALAGTGGDGGEGTAGGVGGRGGAGWGGGIDLTADVASIRLGSHADAVVLGGSGGAGGVASAAGAAGGLGGPVRGGSIAHHMGSLTIEDVELLDGVVISGSGGVGSGGSVSAGSGGHGSLAAGGHLAHLAGDLTVVRSTLAGAVVIGGSGGAGGTATALGGVGGSGGDALGGTVYHGGAAFDLIDSTLSRSVTLGGNGGFGGDAAAGGTGGPGGDGRGGHVFLLTDGAVLSNSTLNDVVLIGGGGGSGGLPDGLPGPDGVGAGGNLALAPALATPATADSTVFANGQVIGGVGPDVHGAVVVCASLVEDPADATLVLAPGPECATLTGVDPLLQPLAENGGPTLTHALDPASPAVNAGVNPLGLATDQRGAGFPRVLGIRADIGAFELGLSLATVTVTVAPASSVEGSGTALVYTLTRTDSEAAPLAAPLTVDFAVAGTATLAADYSGDAGAGGSFGASAGTVVFAAGSPTATVVVTPLDDPTDEPDETVILTVTPNTALYVAGDPAAAEGTIGDDDEPLVTDIPTAGAWGLLLLAVGLGVLAMRRLTVG